MNYIRFFPFIKHLHSFSSSFHSPWASHPVANYIKKNYLCIFTYISIFLCFNMFNIQCYCYLILHPLLSLVSAIHFSLRGIYAHWFNSQKHCSIASIVYQWILRRNASSHGVCRWCWSLWEDRQLSWQLFRRRCESIL